MPPPTIGERLLDALRVLWTLAQMALGFWFYIIVPIAVLVGCYLYIRRSPHVNYGIAGQCEDEGDLEKAREYYERAADHSMGTTEGKIARKKAAEMTRILHQRSLQRDADPPGSD